MKSLSHVLKFSFIFSLMFVFQSMTLTNGVEGTWIYAASDTPYEYSNGEITIKKEEGIYTAMLYVNYNTITIEELTVDQNKVTFSVDIEDAKVDVTLNIDGDTLTGKAESYEGIFKLTGERK